MPVLHLKNREITSKLPAFVMGIVNATPDSFYKGSRGGIERALELVESGADILDIGGESTRPGFTEISVEEELNRGLASVDINTFFFCSSFFFLLISCNFLKNLTKYTIKSFKKILIPTKAKTPTVIVVPTLVKQVFKKPLNMYPRYPPPV